MNPYTLICEALSNQKVTFIIHRHDPRNGSVHHDLRFVDPRDRTKLFSFAAPSNFMDTINSKTVLAKTREHDVRWMTLKSYRLKDIDKGVVNIKLGTEKFFDLEFHGKILKGKYKLFKLKNTKRDDRWLLFKKG